MRKRWPYDALHIIMEFADGGTLSHVIKNSTKRQKLLPEPYRSAWIKFSETPPPGALEKVKKVNK